MKKMKTLSLKLDEVVYKETEQLLEKIKKPRNRYINEAISYYNRLQRRKLIANQLAIESKIVSEDSLAILSEFEKLEDNES
jgi:predicted transcriptional regulator